MLPRTLEPEVMDTPEEARDYDAMDHSTVNRVFVDDFLAAWGDQPAGPGIAPVSIRGADFQSARPPVERADSKSAPRNDVIHEVLDTGTGTALIPIELAGRSPLARIVAIDLAGHMLALAGSNVDRAGSADRITLERVDSKQLPYDDGRFAAVMSNSIVHHIPQPRSVLAEMLRVLEPGGLLFVRDLLRPIDDRTVEELVAAYAGDENAEQRQLFRQSLHAALTVDEVGDLLDSIGLERSCCRRTTDRHWTIVARKP